MTATKTKAPDAAAGRPSVDSLLLPGTPPDIRERYGTLAERALNRDYGLFEPDVVVLDTETTGLSFRTSELMEIAAARMRGREIVGRFHSYCAISGAIPKEIERLTGISDLDLVGAPSAREAVAGLAEFVDGAPILAHNASFDRTFVERVPGGRKVSDTWIDTLALSRIALPRLSSHRLADMAVAFGCHGVAHQASDDVDALCGVWRVMLCGLADLPAGLLSRLADMHPEVADWPYRTVFSQLAGEQVGAEFSLPHERHELVESVRARPRRDAFELDVPLVVPEREEVEEAFSPRGVLPAMYPAFEPRPVQTRMATEVLDAFATSTHRAIEAGTGVGKSMAYLLPAVLFARENDLTVGVATKTNALTDQLVSQELPALDAALPGGVTFFSLKGYDHYPCLRRLERASVGELPTGLAADSGKTKHALEVDQLTAIAVLYSFAAQSPAGDLDSLGIRWRSVPRSWLTTTSNECLHSKCPFYPDGCFVHGARRRAAAADVVVTNHSLLLRNVAADGNILPSIRHWIVDEAHSVESDARRQWAVELSAEASRTCFEQLGGTKTGVIHQALAKTSTSEASTLASGLLAKASASVSRASISMAELFDVIRELVRLAGRDGGYEGVTIWIGRDVRDTPEWAAVQEVGRVAAERLDEAFRLLEDAAEEAMKVSRETAADLVDATCSLKALLDATRLICDGTDESYVYSAQLSRSTSRVGAERLVAEKLDIGSEFATRWLPETKSVVFTSATIAVGEDFSHFDHAVGLDLLGSDAYRNVRLDSSYDYDSQMRVVVARDLPDPRDPGYLEALENLLFDVHVAMDGSVLTLFTNRREMDLAYQALEPRLADAGLDLLCQERGSGTRQLRDRFVSERSLSLFALKSFWEGFDAAGDTLRCVVIPKLPFSSPNDPLSRERDLRESRAWWKYSLPDAVLSVKQASGRLIRTSTDTGVLVMCDSRLMTKRYGRMFLDSLPSQSAVALESETIRRYIETWRRSHE